jgi:SAM-dependent methyltransferase
MRRHLAWAGAWGWPSPDVAFGRLWSARAKNRPMDPARRSETDDWNEHWLSYARSARLNPAQAYRRELIFGALGLQGSRKPVRLLDLGSGTGDFAAEVLAVDRDAEVVGLDLSASGVKIASEKVPRARFFEQDFTKPLTLPAAYRGWATHAVCSELLEHLDDPVAMLANIRPLLAPGCRVVITVPAGPMSAFDKHIGHRRHFRPSTLERTLRDAGLEGVDVRGAGFPFFNAYRLVVLARGSKLIEDARGGEEELPFTAQAMMRVFSLLFRLNTARTSLGWQLLAIGAVPG